MRLSDLATCDDSGPILASAVHPEVSAAEFPASMRTAPCSHGHALADPGDHAIATVTRLTEALKRAKKGNAPAEAELADAEAALARRLRAHVPRGEVK